MKALRVSAAAERDLDEIWNYIAENSGSEEAANGLIWSIAEAFPLFAHVPGAGTRRDEIESNVRGFPVGNYVIYYRETERQVVISRVIHGMRDQRSAFREV